MVVLLIHSVECVLVCVYASLPLPFPPYLFLSPPFALSRSGGNANAENKVFFSEENPKLSKFSL